VRQRLECSHPAYEGSVQKIQRFPHGAVVALIAVRIVLATVLDLLLISGLKTEVFVENFSKCVQILIPIQSLIRSRNRIGRLLAC